MAADPESESCALTGFTRTPLTWHCHHVQAAPPFEDMAQRATGISRGYTEQAVFLLPSLEPKPKAKGRTQDKKVEETRVSQGTSSHLL